MSTQFSWTKQWYPIIPLSYLDNLNPTPITLLGKKLVIWRDKNQKWIVMDDVCPHKLVRLSMGSVTEDGNLMCRHHGWCFDGEGKCTKIPMLAGSQAEVTACDSFRSRVTTYPTQIIQELLWVWADDSSTAFEDCNSKQPATIPASELDISSSSWQMTEVPVGYTVSVESTFDPSHAEFLHEGIGLFSPKTAVPMEYFESVGEISAQEGFTLKHQGYNLFNKDMEAIRKFTPPCSNTTIYRYPNGKTNIFQLYFVPTQPGYCKYIGKLISDGSAVKRNFWFKILPKDLQTGLQHLSTYKLSDQDLSAMHSQEVNQSSLDKKWQKAYFMPSPSDVGIITFRKWLDEFAGGSPSWQGCQEGSIKQLNDEQLYDRWHRHTKHCPSCRNSVVFLEKVQTFSNIGILVFALLTLVFVSIGVNVSLVIISAILAFLSYFLSDKSNNIKQLFFSSIPQRGLPLVKLYGSNKKIYE
ncbi:MAG: Rieske 2Fe-2S domain-containing protein [Nostoc sp. DedQUE08]|uniref:aromatic ring-hydroxylating dioxygenase subunit alpha n=1 Tax=unclassified Nostoc TaxID=2593658 RepID=UPI002AD4D371|nr:MULTISPECIES: Rieske 2Fe-2S domain-containing protein [unclassified Nostoc]MDZ8069187.1 Rieske 2Fe-2S domain-containing protein [Nostoc sp. DedQUE08]MDZ8093209.1 Rieske 2Fe-2S domain-containing protein [Nostoc sp. DedQUE05]